MQFYESLSKEAQTLLVQIVASWQRQGWRHNAGFNIDKGDPAEMAAMDELIDRYVLHREPGGPRVTCTLTGEGRNLLRPVREDLLALGDSGAQF